MLCRSTASHLGDAYYEFIAACRKDVDGLPWVGEDRLIRLKPSAWLALSGRQAKGEPVDSKNHPQTRQRRAAPVTVARVRRSHRRRAKDRTGPESLSRQDRGGSLDRPEVHQDQQQRCRDCRTYCAGLRIESTSRDVINTVLHANPRTVLVPHRLAVNLTAKMLPAERSSRRGNGFTVPLMIEWE